MLKNALSPLSYLRFAGATIGLCSVQAVAMAAAPQIDARGVYQDARVANFVAAEHLGGVHPAPRLRFWSGPRGQVIEYEAKEGAETIILEPAGPTADRSGVRVSTPDGSLWSVTPSAGALLLRDDPTAAPRSFVWEYQGPVDGRGTACSPCVPEAEALQFVRDAFMKAQR